MFLNFSHTTILSLKQLASPKPNYTST